MRNLRILRYETFRAAAADITSLCWDAGKDEVLVTFGPTEYSAKIELARVVEESPSRSSALVCRTVASWNALSPNPEVPVDRVVNLHHFSDNLTTCIVLAGGDIVTVREDESVSSQDGAHIEIMGSIDAGITAARWSPDGELLAIGTKADTVVFMSRSFDGIAEATMTHEDLKLSKHVSVGWGKKETQFQGKGAKALRDPTIPEKVDQGAPSRYEDGRTAISWRGDGSYVAINSVQHGHRRVIRVYTREGVLDSVTEPVDGLEGALSWRPAGNLMAAVQRCPDRVDVVFFERNGLRHGQFTLRGPHVCEGPASNISLEWNSDSTVLAVKYENVVQLWTMGNYHWYLKQEIPTGSLGMLVWHPEKPLRVATAASDKLISVECIFSIARGSLSPPHDYGAVAVIDGTNAKVTPFRSVNIPPPMAMCEISAGSSIVDVAFSPDNAFMGILHHAGIDVYAWQTKETRTLAPKLLTKMEFDTVPSNRHEKPVLQLCLSADNEVYLLRGTDTLEVTSYMFDVTTAKMAFGTVQQVGRGSILVSSSPGASVYMQERSGSLRDLDDPSGSGVEGFSVQLPWTEITSHDDQILAFGLSRGGHLYANRRLLMRNCTSFGVTSEHVVLTTSNHLLKFIHLNDVDALEIPLDDPEQDERCRSLERGARLVTVIPTNMNLVLQMPRGNLETIYPRALVAGGIRRLIDDKNYGRAFSYCRTQRVDMNILYDHKPDQFLANVDLFVKQLKDVTYIDLFLSSLKEEDVTQTMYRDTRPSRKTSGFPGATSQGNPPAAPRAQSSKVNIICDAVLGSLQGQKNANLQNIITAHVCKQPPALDDGLLVAADLMQDDERLAERAVEHICFLVDVNRLYDHALGLYNLDLTLLVAQQSQRDPREYLPFIQSLHKMPELRRKFAIDDHLGHHDKALGHLHALDSFDEVRAYTAKHSLHQTALHLYRYSEAHLRTLTELYAAHLESQSRFREAGLAHESLGSYQRATACYQSAGAACWRECLAAAQSQTPPMAPAGLAALAATLAEALTEAKDHAAAAAIHADYLGAPDAAIRSLCRGYHFAEALRLAARHHRPDRDLAAAAVDSGLADALSSSTELLAECRSQLRAQVPRILELRRRAVEDPLAFYEGERPGDSEVPDDVSVAASSRLSTSNSLFTRYTGGGLSSSGAGSSATRHSHKMRKKEEKKRARGRKGTVYEEEYLVNSVRRLIVRVDGSARPEVERLVAALVRRGMAERARAVEKLAAEVVDACKAAVAEIWGDRAAAAAKGGMVTAGGSGSGGDGAGFGDANGTGQVDADGWRGEGSYGVAPVVGEFQKLSLLGG